MNTSEANTTLCKADISSIAQSEIPDSHFQRSAVLGGSDLEPEEHVLFVLHPARTEKGDLL